MASEKRHSDSGTSWLKQLRQRKLVQWTAAYAAGAWLVLQVLDTIGPRWGLSEWATRIIDVVLIVGFFVTLVLAWYHGEKGRQRVSGPELLILGALLLIGGVALQLLRSEAEDVAQPGHDVDAAASTTTSPSPLKSIAVLPFDNYSPNPDDAYFAAGVTEEITSQLSRIGDLTVVSRVAVERAMKSEESLDGIARRLRAGSVLEGSVRMAGTRVRITAQLIDMRTAQHLWAENFDREFSDIFAIQTDVALAIGEALLATLSTGERRRIETPATHDIRAYQLYLKQTGLLGNRPDENAEAIRLLTEAVALDPEFAAALAQLAWRYVWQYRLMGDVELANRALTFARRALALDSELAEAYYALGAAYLSVDQYTDSFEAFDQALVADPKLSSALLDGSLYDAQRGLFVSALDRAFRAVRVSPNDANTRWHAVAPLIYLGDADRASAWLDLAVDEGMKNHRLDIARIQVEMLRGNVKGATAAAHSVMRNYADVPEVITWVSSLLFILGDWRSVRDNLVAMGRDAPDSSYTDILLPRMKRTFLAFVLAEEGQIEEAQRLFDESLATGNESVKSDSSYFLPFIDVAATYAYRGLPDEALDNLEQAFTAGFLADYTLRTDPMFVSLRDDARFDDLLKRMVVRRSQLQKEAVDSGALLTYDEMIAAGPLEP